MYQPPQRVVTRRGANHGLHILLTILTCGLWAVTGWPIAAILGRKTKTTTTPVYGVVPPQLPQGYFPPPGPGAPGYQAPPPGYRYQQQPPPPAPYGPPPQP